MEWDRSLQTTVSPTYPTRMSSVSLTCSLLWAREPSCSRLAPLKIPENWGLNMTDQSPLSSSHWLGELLAPGRTPELSIHSHQQQVLPAQKLAPLSCTKDSTSQNWHSPARNIQPVLSPQLEACSHFAPLWSHLQDQREPEENLLLALGSVDRQKHERQAITYHL